MLPNTVASIIVNTTFIIAGAMYVEAALDFLASACRLKCRRGAICWPVPRVTSRLTPCSQLLGNTLDDRHPRRQFHRRRPARRVRSPD
jgi:hypothetical protein